MTDDQTALDKLLDPEMWPTFEGRLDVSCSCRADLIEDARTELAALRSRVAALEKACEAADALAEAIDEYHGHELTGDEAGCRVCETWRAYRSAREASR